MNYWLMKSEPNAFSLEQLIKIPNQTTHWDGVRNYQARNMLRDQMKVGDQAFFYHSNCDPSGIVGIIEIARAGYPDFTAFDPEDSHYDPKSKKDSPTWFMVDVRFIKKLRRLIPLAELKQNPALNNFALVRKGNRLSVMPVSKSEWQAILAQE
jgi:predicted RNA-binding protein with PUA-like domain